MRPIFTSLILLCCSVVVSSCGAPEPTAQSSYPPPPPTLTPAYPVPRTPTPYPGSPGPTATVIPPLPTMNEGYPMPAPGGTSTVPTPTLPGPRPTKTPDPADSTPPPNPVPELSPTFPPTVVSGDTTTITVRASTRTDVPKAMIKVGNYVRIKVANENGWNTPWTLTYNTTVLRLDAGAAQNTSPSTGWRWKGLKAGTTRVELTSNPPCSNIRCPPAFRYVVDVQVVP